MPLVRVKPDDLDQVAAVVDILNAARRVDDPEALPELVELMAGELAYGWDLEPPEQFLYTPDGADDPVATSGDRPAAAGQPASGLGPDRGPSRPSAAGSRIAVDGRGAAHGRRGGATHDLGRGGRR